MATSNPQKEIGLLKEKLKQEKELTKTLKEEIEILYLELEKMQRNIGLEKILHGFTSKSFTAAASDLLMDPNPFDIVCSGEKTDTSEIYSVRLLNILAIHSRKRPKDIFLKKPISSKSGGKEKSVITFDKNGINFNELLSLIQRRGDHLLRVHNSWAINIYHYTFSNKNTFILNAEMQSGVDKEIHQIPIDANFNKDLYQKRLFEIEKLQEHQIGTQFNLQKIEEIRKLKEDLGLS